MASASGVEISLELVQTAQIPVDGGSQFGRRFARLVGWGQQFPEQAVVPVTTAIVANSLGQFGDAGKQLFQRLALQAFVSIHGLVQVVDIGLMMLVVVEGHRLLVDGRFQGVIGVREGRKGEGHWGLLGWRV